jgi:hypothetical protein
VIPWAFLAVAPFTGLPDQEMGFLLHYQRVSRKYITADYIFIQVSEVRMVLMRSL